MKSWNFRCLAFASAAVIALGVFLVLAMRDDGHTASQDAAAQDAPVHAQGKPRCRGAGAEAFAEDELKAAEALSAAAVRGDGDLVARAREWAGTNVARRIWVCDIVRNARRTDALAVLARDALDACRGGGATYGRLFRIAKFLEECRDWTAARAALDIAAPLAKYRTHREDVAFARLRIDIAAEGATVERLGELRRISVSATMNDNRLAAARLLRTYGR